MNFPAVIRVLGLVALVALMCAGAPVHAQFEDRDALPFILKLKNPKPAVRQAAAQKLQEYTDDTRIVVPLIAALHDTDAATRKFAVGTLGQTGDARAVEPLISLLNDANPNIRTAVIQALGCLEDTRAVEPLIALAQNDPALKWTTLRALAGIADPRVTDLLLAAMSDPKQGIQAALWLAGRGDARAADPLLAIACNKKDPYHLPALQALLKLPDTRVITRLLPALQAKPQDSTDEIALLAEYGDPRVVPLLIVLLNDPEQGLMAGPCLRQLRDSRAVDALSHIASKLTPGTGMQENAIAALGEIRDPRAVPALVTALRLKYKADDSMPSLIIEALGKIGDAAALDVLVAQVKSANTDIRACALQGLADSGSPKALDALLAATKQKNSENGELALKGLVKIPDARAMQHIVTMFSEDGVRYFDGDELFTRLLANPALTIEDLLALFQQDTSFIQLDLLTALGKTTIKDPRLLPAMVRAIDGGVFTTAVDDVASAFKPYGRAGVDALIARLARKDGQHGMIILVLGHLGDPRAAPALLPYAKNQFDQKEALEALARLQPELALQTLLEKALAKDPTERCSALRALGGMHDARIFDLLTSGLREQKATEAASVRAAAASGLGKTGDARAVAPLVAALADESDDVRYEAAMSLASLPPDPATIAPLLTMLNNRHNVRLRFAAVRALTPIKDERILPALLRATRWSRHGHEAPELCAIFSVLADRPDPRSVPVLISFATDEYITDVRTREQAVIALAQQKDPRAVVPLLRALKDESPIVRAATAATLHTLTGQQFGVDHSQWVQWWLTTQNTP